MALTSKQEQFLASYKLTQDAALSALNAGYSAKNAAPQGCRLLKHPEILAAIDQWKAEKAKQVSKDDFIDLAMTDYSTLDATHGNKPRFLDIAGKALGYTTPQKEIGESKTLNLTQININGTDQAALWEATRKLLEDDSA